MTVADLALTISPLSKQPVRQLSIAGMNDTTGYRLMKLKVVAAFNRGYAMALTLNCAVNDVKVMPFGFAAYYGYPKLDFTFFV